MSAQPPTNLHFPVERDGYGPVTHSTGAFLAMVSLVLPLWATVVLPLTVTYQAGKAIVGVVLPKDSEPPIKVDSGYKVAEGEIIPRPERKYDVVLLGATGFTGGLAMRHLAKTYGVNKNVKWAIAGRSQAKLDKVKKSLAKELNQDDILQLDTIIVDTSVASMLPNLVRDTRAVVTTAGPFHQYGNFVVEFCAKFGTHYSDTTGEVDWVKTMILKWQDTAKKTGAKILSLCGNDCIPWDLTCYLLAKKLETEKGEDLASVTCIDEFKSSISGGTLKTMALIMSGKVPLAPSKDPFRYTAAGTVHSKPFQSKLPFSIFKCNKPWNGQTAYGSPFAMALVNAEAASWTQALRGGAPLSYSEYQVSPDMKSAFVDYFGLIVFFSTMMNPVTGYLLNTVLPKPGEGPSMKNMEESHFCSVYANGVGTKGTEVESIMYFPRDTGYLDTGRMVVESGLSLALEEENLPVKSGGFFSPAFALGDVLLKRLSDTGTHYELKIKDTNN